KQYESNGTAEHDRNTEVTQPDEASGKRPELPEVIKDQREDDGSECFHRELRHREVWSAEEQKRKCNSIAGDSKRQDGSDGRARSYGGNSARDCHECRRSFGGPHI